MGSGFKISVEFVYLLQLWDRGVALDPIRLLADDDDVVVCVATIRIDSIDRR